MNRIPENNLQGQFTRDREKMAIPRTTAEDSFPDRVPTSGLQDNFYENLGGGVGGELREVERWGWRELD